MTWIRLDPQELGSAGATLRDVSQVLVDTTTRTRAACCVPGLGRHASPLMAEAEAVAVRVTGVTEQYLRLAIDILQRAIAAIREGQLVSSVATVGGLSTAVIGGSVVGGTSPGWSGTMPAPTMATIGGTSWTSGLTVGGLGTSTIGGGYAAGFIGGGSGLAAAAMTFATMAAASQQNQQTRIAGLQTAGGRGTTSGDLGNQMLIDMVNRQNLKTIAETEVKIAASQPFAGIVQAENADKIDFMGRARKIENDQYYEKKRLGLT